MRAKDRTDRSRVGILTFTDSTSFGAVLQMHALYKAVESCGSRPEIIHYQNRYMRTLQHTSSAYGSPVRSVIRRLARYVIHRKSVRGFRRFEMRLEHYPHFAFRRKERLLSLAGRYAAVICGSDQVWNPEITGCDLSFFLDFCGSGTARVSYAPSFGSTDLPEDFVKAAAKELGRFKALSVREAKGREKVAAMTGCCPANVLDPVFLMPRSYWSSLGKPSGTEGPYILYYAVRQSEEMRAFCERLAERKRLPVLVVGGNLFSGRRAGGRVRFCPDLDPVRWLYLVEHAEYIVTNSFHGLAFSIIFRRNFFLGLSSLTNDRLTDLISELKLGEQIIGPKTHLNETDYTAAEGILPGLAERSMAYLRQALGYICDENRTDG